MQIRFFRRSRRLLAALRSLVLAGSLASSFAAPAPAQAQTPLIIGQSCDLSGPSSVRVKDFARGADAYIASVNAQGGVHGRPIRLVRYDDAFQPAKTLENTKRLVEQDGAFALFGMGSAPSTAAVLPYAVEKGIPIFGSLSGADSIRAHNPMMFHFSASFGDEVVRIAEHLAILGIKRVAALASDLPIGKDGVVALSSAASKNGMDLVSVQTVAQDLGNLASAVAEIEKAKPQVVLILAPAGPGIKFIEALQKSALKAQLIGLSVMSSDSLYKALGDAVRGMIITQTVPFPWKSQIGIAVDYRKLMASEKIEISIDTMTGYVAARLLIDALKAAGPKATRASFVAAMEAMNNRDVAGLAVSMSPKDHVATRMVNITMIGSAGKLVN